MRLRTANPTDNFERGRQIGFQSLQGSWAILRAECLGGHGFTYQCAERRRAKVRPLLLSVYAAIRPSGVTSNARAAPATTAFSMVRRIGGRALRHVLLPFPPRHGSKKRLGVLVSRHSKDVGCGTPFDDQPIFHDRDLLADVCGNPQIVCNEQH